MTIFRCLSALGALLVALGAPPRLSAQPSGGPYGPTRQTYELPAVTGKILYAAPDGRGDRPGATPSEPTTLEAAIDRARTGDAIILRGGEYRTGNLILNQGITIQPYAGEQPVLKGTAVAAQWENLGNGLWNTKWPHLFPAKPADWWRRGVDGLKTPLHRFNNDMVFIDGRFLQSAGWPGEVDEKSFYIDYDAGVVYIGTNPANHVIEITAFDVALLRTTKEAHGKQPDHRGVTLRGITFSGYAYRALEVEGKDPEGPSDESRHGKEVVGTTLEDCTISYCSRVAAYLRGDSLTVRHCKISDTSTEGLYIIGSNDVLLEGNIFQRNNIEDITGYFPAAVKIFNQCYRVTCRDNLVTDLPNSNGIWYDVGNVDGVFVNNWIENVGHAFTVPAVERMWPSQNGFFFEISRGAVCAGNVFVNCEHALMVLNSSDVRICQNTFVNSLACIGRNGRTAAGDRFGWHASTGPALDKREGQVVVNNLFTGDERFARPLLLVWQPAALCAKLPHPQLQRLEHNVYVRGMANAPTPLILWSPGSGDSCQTGFATVDSLRSLFPRFEAGSLDYIGYGGPLFRGEQVGNYQLLPAFAGARAAAELPAEIARFLPGAAHDKAYVGAYPPLP